MYIEKHVLIYKKKKKKKKKMFPNRLNMALLLRAWNWKENTCSGNTIFTLDPYLIVLSIIFWVFGMTRPGIEPRSPRPLANTLLIRLMAQSDKIDPQIVHLSQHH